MNQISTYRRLIKLSLSYWRGFLVAVLAMAVTAATEAAFPALMKPLLDKGFAGPKNLEIWKVPVFILGIFLLRGISGFIGSYALSWISHGVLRDLRKLLFEKLLLLPVSFVDKRTPGSVLTTLTTELLNLGGVAAEATVTIVRDGLILIGLIGWLFYLNWKLAVVVLVTAPLLALSTKALSIQIRKRTHRWLSLNREIAHTVEQAIGGIRIIKIFGAEKKQQGHFNTQVDSLRSAMLKADAAGLIQTPITQFFAATTIALVLAVALAQAKTGILTVGEFVSFVTAMLMTLSPIKHLSQVNSMVQRALASAENIFEFLDSSEEEDSGVVEIKRAAGNIRLESVTLTYPGRDAPALKDLNLEISAGETVAFVGPSGGGKTSILSLLTRFQYPNRGRILLDGVDICDIELKNLRAQFAYVPQDVVLFHDTIFENLRIGAGMQDLTEDQAWQALSDANLEIFVRGLPDRLHTQIGSRGMQLSGGQRQRLAIARAMLKNAPILLMDEATSALDSQSEAMVKQAIARVSRNRTTLVVAHRLSTVVDANRIVVMVKGVIKEIGQHAELMAKGGLYSQLHFTSDTSAV